MKNHFIFILAVLLNFSSLGFCADSAAHPAITFDSMPDQFALQIVPRNFEVRQAVVSGVKSNELFFDVAVENPSAVHKHDIVLPLDVRLRDEFGNSYLNRHFSGKRRSLETAETELSLYPGEKVYFSFRFQTPVAAAKQLDIEIFDQANVFYGRTLFYTDEIKNWKMRQDEPQRTSDDLKIIYPVEKRIFSAGETVFLKVDFSESAGRPKNIHVILPDYVLTDHEAQGMYELQLSPDMAEGDFQVIVMAEWGESPHIQVISKTLFLQIKG